MSEKKHVDARIPKGFQDILPGDLIPRKRVIAAIESVFERFGFLPLETPAVEYLDILLGTGGEETNKELFRLDTPEGEPAALRFDLTVPFARILAQYPEIKLPFRRYALGTVWRADKPGPGRYRQFTQFDVDAAGSESLAVDGEIIGLMCQVMAALRIENYAVLVNNRKLLDAVLSNSGIDDPARQKHVLRVIDKLAKVGVQNVRLELASGRIDDSGDPIPGVNLPADTIEQIMRFVAIEADTRQQVMACLRDALADTEASRAALAEMDELASALDALGLDDRHVRFQPSLARGLDYYTGPVFEAVLTDAPEFGSVMGGGRYNGLVDRFMDTPIPCTGVAVGLDRLIPALRKLNLGPETATTVQVLVVTMGKVPFAETLKVASQLRESGIATEAYFGPKMSMKAQLSHADRWGVPVAVILGEDELSRGEVAIKDLLAGKLKREDIQDHEAYRMAGKTGQMTVSRSELVSTVRQLLRL
jgi:histidyl-tRNA synthetase